MPKNTDSIEGKSSDDLKEMLMQTSVPDSGVEEEREEAAVEEESVEVETTPEETVVETETEKEVKAEEEEAEKRYKLKVEGKEEELTLSKILEYAQKGRFLEKERARDKEKMEKLEKEGGEKTVATGLPNISSEKLNEWFMEEVQKNPIATLLNVVSFGVNNVLSEKEGKQKQEKSEEKKFELEREAEDKELWKQLKPTFQSFRDMGHSRESSYAMATADFYRDVAIRAMEQGIKKGEKKAKMKQAAEIPTGEKRLRSSTEAPSAKDASKMTSAELKKHLRYIKHPDW